MSLLLALTVAAGSSFSYAGSGGIAFSGTAAATVDAGFVVTGNGELVISGAATTTHNRQFAFLPAGGVVYSGAAAATQSRIFSQAGTGGLTLLGSATASRTPNFNAIGSGGLTFSGQAAAYREFSFNASGGMLLSGAATASQLRNFVFTPTGGLQLGGSAIAAPDFGYRHQASGGLQFGGQSGNFYTIIWSDPYYSIESSVELMRAPVCSEGNKTQFCSDGNAAQWSMENVNATHVFQPYRITYLSHGNESKFHSQIYQKPVATILAQQIDFGLQGYPGSILNGYVSSTTIEANVANVSAWSSSSLVPAFSANKFLPAWSQRQYLQIQYTSDPFVINQANDSSVFRIAINYQGQPPIIEYQRVDIVDTWKTFNEQAAADNGSYQLRVSVSPENNQPKIFSLLLTVYSA